MKNYVFCNEKAFDVFAAHDMEILRKSEDIKWFWHDNVYIAEMLDKDLNRMSDDDEKWDREFTNADAWWVECGWTLLSMWEGDEEDSYGNWNYEDAKEQGIFEWIDWNLPISKERNVGAYLRSASEWEHMDLIKFFNSFVGKNASV